MKVKVAPLESPDTKKGFDKYEKESFHRTLMEAEIIKNDPKKRAAAMEVMKEHGHAMSSLSKGMNMEDLVEHASNLPSDVGAEECDACGADMTDMSKSEITNHNKSHEAKKSKK